LMVPTRRRLRDLAFSIGKPNKIDFFRANNNYSRLMIAFNKNS
jgi:hypothetical protein